VIRRFELKGDRRQYDAEGSIRLAHGGWVLLRAWNDGAHPQVLDLYPYATTSPVYIAAPAALAAPGDAAYFTGWMDRVIEAAEAPRDWNHENERQMTLEYLRSAREILRARGAGPD
jgi:hypothetical protein